VRLLCSARAAMLRQFQRAKRCANVECLISVDDIIPESAPDGRCLAPPQRNPLQTVGV
jgi:hypothetical protein